MSQFVCVRITTMAGIDINLFDFDRHNALYFFVLNADEQIYLRYGGRDSASATTYLNLKSLELALEQGLAAHEQWKASGRPKTKRPSPLYPREMDLLRRRTINRRRCVECHLIDDYRAQQLEIDGELNKLKTMYRSPDIKSLGIHLDVPRGLVVGEAKGAAATAGIRQGDRIVRIGEQPVLTFGDLQHYYDKTPRDAKRIQLTVVRTNAGDRQEKRARIDLELPHQWWRTDLDFRNWSIDPLVYYESRPLTKNEKSEHGLPANGFASQVTHVGSLAKRAGLHDLQVGDITYSVDGTQADEVADSTELFIKLRKDSGDRLKIGVIRDGKKLDIDLRTRRRTFRK
ncbi:MAG: hypothetical protein CMJ84_12105 [Planctomycetes bacterium]|nr:hypothetical protein [Planctomycetota bacterium]